MKRGSRPVPDSNASYASEISQEKDVEKGESDDSIDRRDLPAGVCPGDVHRPANQDEPAMKEEDEVMRHNQEEEPAHGPGPQPEQVERRDYDQREAVETPRREEVEEPVMEPHRETELRPTHSRRSGLSRLASARTAGSALGTVLTGVNIRKRTTNEGGAGDVFIVGFQGANDPLDPHNWSYALRIWVTMQVAAIGFVVGVASSIDSSAIPHAAVTFGVSEVVASLATGLYLIGFGVGALFAGPFSETLGRNAIYIATLTIYMIFIMAAGLAPNIGAWLAFRFLAGFFGSTPLTCAGGSLSDIWSPWERIYFFPVFANAAFLGPIIGPVIGGYIVTSPLLNNWRWTEWITLIISGAVLVSVVLTQPETFPPILLKWKAAHMRAITGDDRYRAEVEVRRESFFHRLGRALYRPFLLTATEPIIVLVALYLTVIYIVLFTFLDGYTYIFEEIHHTSEGVTGLCFLGIAIGLFGASALVPFIAKLAKKKMAEVHAAGKTRLPPEFRLWFAMLAGPSIPVSLFWMAWTSDSNISIWSPLAASVLFGYGILCIFISCYQYVIDSYEIYAASALASITLIRYVAAGGMTVVGIPFYQNMGVHYTLTILACLSIPLVPVPFVFYKYGHRIRARSRYAPKHE